MTKENCDNLIIVEAKEKHYNDIDKLLDLLRSMGYTTLEADSATHVVAYDKEIVGAFELDISASQCRTANIRINWLVASKQSSQKKLKVGSCIVQYAIKIATEKSCKYIFVSVKKSTDEANGLYEKYRFITRSEKQETENERDMMIKLY